MPTRSIRDFPTDAGERLVKARKAKQITQLGLSVLLNGAIDPSSISAYERGAKFPNYRNRLRLARVLEISAEELFGEAHEEMS